MLPMNWRQAEEEILKDFINANEPFGGTPFTERLRLYRANAPVRTRIYDTPRRLDNRSLRTPGSQDFMRRLRARDMWLPSLERPLWLIEDDWLAPVRREEPVSPISAVHKIRFDVEHYSANDLSVKVVDRFVIIKGQHSQRQEAQCWATRQFVKKYKVPDNVNLDLLRCDLSADKYLTITAPIIVGNPTVSHRLVPIRVASAMGAQIAGSEQPPMETIDGPQRVGNGADLQVNVVNANADSQAFAGNASDNPPRTYAADADAGPAVPPNVSPAPGLM